MDIQIKKVGDKLRDLRKSLGLKQEDLVKHNVINNAEEISFTRNLISMVETGKSPLTKKLAGMIHKNLITACNESGVSFDCDFDEVCMTPEAQIYRYITTYTEDGFDSMDFEDAVKYGEELIELSENYNMQPALSTLYRFLGEKHKRTHFELASKYYLKATVLKSELSDIEYTSLVKSLKAVFIMLGQYSDALALRYNKFSGITSDTLRCHFNDILCLKNLQRYDEALSMISDIGDVLQKEDKKLFIKIKILEANILILKEDLYSAKKIYDSLLSICTSTENILVLKNNLLHLKFSTTSCTATELEEFSSQVLCEEFSPILLSSFYMTLSEGYEEIDMVESVNYFEKLIDLALSGNVVSAETKIYFNTVIYRIMDNVDKMDIFQEENADRFKDLVATGLERDLLTTDTVFKVLLYFQDKFDYQFVNKLLSSKVS